MNLRFLSLAPLHDGGLPAAQGWYEEAKAKFNAELARAAAAAAAAASSSTMTAVVDQAERGKSVQVEHIRLLTLG